MAGVCVPWGGGACRLISPIRRRFPVSSSVASLALPDSSSMIVDDNLGAFLEILPKDLRHRLLNDSRRNQLVEVIMDLGRPPEARYLGEPGGQYLRNNEVSMEELEDAQELVGEFGADNRAGIEGTLHRISAIRNRKGFIVGLTCRVGRAVSGHIDMLYDLLHYGKSILFVGRPGVGKTTVLREIARVLSDEFQKRVVIIDTSNEIGGDGDIPHSAIGGIETVTLGDEEARARRSQKSILERKAPPTFYFLIEMRERDYWIAHQTEKSVDMLLRGRNPMVEVRRRDEEYKVVIERWKAYDGQGI
ncbi:P-loop containing nucleoside triphosphate hydrolases superfamily protein [Arabidopsis thaliana]|uniref:P-loop containing nucleoside triphosphate hydrolases superfamily protein n=1 Tax=Arabidopsis thaliana TaxID=3702 RepID=Q0WPP7_ARATH|nr:P-loop containing nucleoside triphosphate hydrolases superfamily protein [Arabidopsis thaliana]AEE31582.1 P-loop containing nucleoside triphosphate hydrolases superfamily protein [Arabidopsis thaliana]BAF00902.1 hypothetical protein [Arabidopsis thaliana]|eukprot:NP_849744.1 P-loop containing nucleoside triphosphate hydrolases superfamily protein [Arabidopsis thaliana]